jgi:hypothetical protein
MDLVPKTVHGKHVDTLEPSDRPIIFGWLAIELVLNTAQLIYITVVWSLSCDRIPC